MGGRAATPAPPAQAQCCCTTRQGRRCAFPALFRTLPGVCGSDIHVDVLGCLVS